MALICHVGSVYGPDSLCWECLWPLFAMWGVFMALIRCVGSVYGPDSLCWECLLPSFAVWDVFTFADRVT